MKHKTLSVLLFFFSCMVCLAQEWTREVQLSKDFDNTLIPDTLRIRRFDPYTIPPSVLTLYILYMDKLDSIYQVKSLVISDNEQKELEKLMPTGKQRFYPFTSDYHPGFVYGGNDFNHALSMIFSAHYRQLMRNRKNATAFKSYYDAGTVRPSIFTQLEREQLNQSVNSIRQTVSISSPNRKSGIDD